MEAINKLNTVQGYLLKSIYLTIVKEAYGITLVIIPAPVFELRKE